jgi:GrpB-like predicted nucleotidyltransferase (UPF0157 family)
MMAERVEIVPYDDAWPEHFLTIAGALRLLLGAHVVGDEYTAAKAASVNDVVERARLAGI